MVNEWPVKKGHPLFFLFFSSFIFFQSIVFAGPTELIDDLPRIHEKVFYLLKRWDVSRFSTFFDDTGRLVKPITAEEFAHGLNVRSIKLAEALFRGDLEEQLVKVYKSEEFAELPPLLKTQFQDAAEQLRRVRQGFTRVATPCFRHVEIESVFKLLNAEEALVLKVGREGREAILRQARRVTGDLVSDVLQVSKGLRAGERFLTALERSSILEAMKLKYGSLSRDGRLDKLRTRLRRWEMRRPQGKTLRAQLINLKKKISDLETAQERLLSEIFYLQEVPQVKKVRFIEAFQNSRLRLQGLQPPIEQQYAIGAARFGKFFGDTWVGTCNLTSKLAHGGPVITAIEGLIIIKGSLITVFALSVLVPPSQSVVGDFLTMMAFKTLWWKYKDFISEDNVGGTYKSSQDKTHDLTKACPICHPEENKNFFEEWKNHGMPEFLQVDNELVNGNLNNYFLSLFYASNAAMTAPMTKGRNLYIELLTNVLYFKMTYVTNEILQHVIWLRLGKKAESYAEKKMLLQDINVSILSNYWIVEFSFLYPIIEPNLERVVYKSLYHMLFPHYLHRQPQLIETRYKKISEFLLEIKKDENKVVEKAKEFGFQVSDVSLGDVGQVPRTEKKPFYVPLLQYPLLGHFLEEQQSSLGANPFKNLDLLPRLDAAREQMNEAFKTKKILLPAIEGSAFLFDDSDEGEELNKRQIIEEMIEKMKEKQQKFIDDLLRDGILGLSISQQKMASDLNRNFPKTSEEVERLLGTTSVELGKEIQKIGDEYQAEMDKTLEAIKKETVENSDEAMQTLHKKYQEKYGELVRRFIEKIDQTKEVASQNIATILENSNSTKEEFKEFRREYDRFVIQNLASLSKLQTTLEAQDQKLAELIQALGEELKTAQLDRAELKRMLENIQTELTQRIAVAIEDGNKQTAAKLEEIHQLLEKIYEILKSGK